MEEEKKREGRAGEEGVVVRAISQRAEARRAAEAAATGGR
jgi:hypothetical protein